jgi:hypothetical protein
MRAVIVVVACAAAVLAAALEVLLVPLRSGTVLIPIAILISLAGNVIFPLIARAAYDTAVATVAPVLCWLIAVVVLAMAPRPEGDVLVPGGGGEQWVFYGVLFGGVVAGCVTAVLTAPRPMISENRRL